MTRLRVIVEESLNFREGLMEVGYKVKIQLTWLEANSNFPEHFPQKTELDLLEFYRKSFMRLSNDISKTMEKCEDFYKKIHQAHEECQIPLVSKITDLQVRTNIWCICRTDYMKTYNTSRKYNLSMKKILTFGLGRILSTLTYQETCVGLPLKR